MSSVKLVLPRTFLHRDLFFPPAPLRPLCQHFSTTPPTHSFDHVDLLLQHAAPTLRSPDRLARSGAAAPEPPGHHICRPSGTAAGSGCPRAPPGGTAGHDGTALAGTGPVWPDGQHGSRCRHRFVGWPRHWRPLQRRLFVRGAPATAAAGAAPPAVRSRADVGPAGELGPQLLDGHTPVYHVHGRAVGQHADLRLVPGATESLPGRCQAVLIYGIL